MRINRQNDSGLKNNLIKLELNNTKYFFLCRFILNLNLILQKYVVNHC